MTHEQHLQQLEDTVALFARQLQEAQEAGVPLALLGPRMIAAYKRATGADMADVLGGTMPTIDWAGYGG